MTSANNENPSKRTISHKRLRYTSLATGIIGLIGFPIAFVLYVWATASCWGAAQKFGLCEIFSSLPWIGLVISFAAYLFIMWIIHELGHEHQTEVAGRRYAWKKAKHGYKGLDQGHHHLVRRVHRVSSVAFAGLAAYISFQFFEADTLVNIAVALIAYIAGELLNWKKFTKINY